MNFYHCLCMWGSGHQRAVALIVNLLIVLITCHYTFLKSYLNLLTLLNVGIWILKIQSWILMRNSILILMKERLTSYNYCVAFMFINVLLYCVFRKARVNSVHFIFTERQVIQVFFNFYIFLSRDIIPH